VFRFLEFVNCCCGGAENSTGNRSDGGEELIMYPCKDVMFHHPRTSSCEALAQMPSSHPLDGYLLLPFLSPPTSF